MPDKRPDHESPPADNEPLDGSTEAVHDEITPHDLPKDHPGRADLVSEVGEDGTTRGNT